jgi:hypothetical protein
MMNKADEYSQSVKREVLTNDQKVKDTYFSRANADADLGGRFAPAVIGSTARYPHQPTTSPFSRDPVPDEPPLGYEIHSQEPVGEPFEVQQSLAKASSSSRMGDDALLRPSSVSPPRVGGGRVLLKRRI